MVLAVVRDNGTKEIQMSDASCSATMIILVRVNYIKEMGVILCGVYTINPINS